MITRVFVYGTLLTGLRNHHVIAAGRLVGAAETLGQWRLYSCGSFPAMTVGIPGDPPVVGEVFEVDDRTLARLDALEGIAFGHYSRTVISVRLPGGPVRPRRVHTYVQPRERFTSDGLVVGGDWRRHLAALASRVGGAL